MLAKAAPVPIRLRLTLRGDDASIPGKCTFGFTLHQEGIRSPPAAFLDEAEGMHTFGNFP
jgi:hypothetical protein